jgi:hypothetical protein
MSLQMIAFRVSSCFLYFFLQDDSVNVFLDSWLLSLSKNEFAVYCPIDAWLVSFLSNASCIHFMQDTVISMNCKKATYVEYSTCRETCIQQVALCVVFCFVCLHHDELRALFSLFHLCFFSGRVFQHPDCFLFFLLSLWMRSDMLLNSYSDDKVLFFILLLVASRVPRWM